MLPVHPRTESRVESQDQGDFGVGGATVTLSKLVESLRFGRKGQRRSWRHPLSLGPALRRFRSVVYLTSGVQVGRTIPR